jgi:hypothetical protein
VGAGGNKINYAKRLNNQARPFIVMAIFFSLSTTTLIRSITERKSVQSKKEEEGKSFGPAQFVLLKITTKFTTGDCRNSTLFFYSTLPSRAERERDTKWLYANEGKTACATGSPVS